MGRDRVHNFTVFTPLIYPCAADFHLYGARGRLPLRVRRDCGQEPRWWQWRLGRSASIRVVRTLPIASRSEARVGARTAAAPAAGTAMARGEGCCPSCRSSTAPRREARTRIPSLCATDDRVALRLMATAPGQPGASGHGPGRMAWSQRNRAASRLERGRSNRCRLPSASATQTAATATRSTAMPGPEPLGNGTASHVLSGPALEPAGGVAGPPRLSGGLAGCAARAGRPLQPRCEVRRPEPACQETVYGPGPSLHDARDGGPDSSCRATGSEAGPAGPSRRSDGTPTLSAHSVRRSRMPPATCAERQSRKMPAHACRAEVDIVIETSEMKLCDSSQARLVKSRINSFPRVS
jgi:hypothetical protein